jgi:hypothetical protein
MAYVICIHCKNEGYRRKGDRDWTCFRCGWCRRLAIMLHGRREPVEKVDRGTMFARWKVARTYKKGPYTFVDVICTCPNHTRNHERPLVHFTSGKSLSCGCLRDEWRASTKPWREYLKLLDTLRAEIRKRFPPDSVLITYKNKDIAATGRAATGRQPLQAAVGGRAAQRPTDKKNKRRKKLMASRASSLKLRSSAYRKKRAAQGRAV